MKNRKGFTLIELMAVIVILGITITLVFVKVDNNIKKASDFGTERQIESIESAAYLYVEDYLSSLPNIETKKVDIVTIDTLINSGLLKSKDVEGIDSNNIILIAKINNVYKIKYTGNKKSVIFLNGPTEMSLYKNETYSEMGAYVAIPDTGVVELSSENMNSNVNTSNKGTYKVIYSYTDATSIIRTVKVI